MSQRSHTGPALLSAVVAPACPASRTHKPHVKDSRCASAGMIPSRTGQAGPTRQLTRHVRRPRAAPSPHRAGWRDCRPRRDGRAPQHTGRTPHRSGRRPHLVARRPHRDCDGRPRIRGGRGPDRGADRGPGQGRGTDLMRRPRWIPIPERQPTAWTGFSPTRLLRLSKGKMRLFRELTARRPRQCRGWVGVLPQNGGRQVHRRARTH